MKNFREDPRWINQQLATTLHPDEIKRSIEILIELNLLKRDSKNRLSQTQQKITTTPEMGSLAIINFHREMLKKASESLEKNSMEDRDVSALTIAISRRQYTQIKERLNQFRREVHAIASSVEPSEVVYQLNFQLFNLSRILWG